jgi:hypothetical protein
LLEKGFLGLDGSYLKYQIFQLVTRSKQLVDSLSRACRITEIGACGQRFQPKKHRVLILG